ncbi:hypothetical protein RRG08_061248 [Elysia crispata]|uniref:Uncharacterized protein n=1 Tax=Elysia crispata TaxID=231223 RepID=A0AAE0ZG36_9GAST|nr:hypothetical protein RRG08_061248 [Elysia crispata]
MVCAWPYEQQWDFCEEKNNVPSLRLADAGYDGEEIKTAFSNRILSQEIFHACDSVRLSLGTETNCSDLLQRDGLVRTTNRQFNIDGGLTAQGRPRTG